MVMVMVMVIIVVAHVSGLFTTHILHFMKCHRKKCHRPRTSSCQKEQRGGTEYELSSANTDIHGSCLCGGGAGETERQRMSKRAAYTLDQLFCKRQIWLQLATSGVAEPLHLDIKMCNENSIPLLASVGQF